MPDKETARARVLSNGWWAATGVWAALYIVASILDHSWVAEVEAGNWLSVLDVFSVGAIGVVSVAALAIEYRTRQKAQTEDK